MLTADQFRATAGGVECVRSVGPGVTVFDE